MGVRPMTDEEIGAVTYKPQSFTPEQVKEIVEALKRHAKQHERAFITPVPSWRGMRYPDKRFVADVETAKLCKYRYFRSSRKAERWARRYTQNVRHL